MRCNEKNKPCFSLTRGRGPCICICVCVWLCLCLGVGSGLFGLPQANATQTASDTITSIEAIGLAPVRDNNVAAARDEAVEAALLAAFDRLILEQVPAPLLVKEFETLVAGVYSQFNRYVQSYRVLAEVRSGNRYRVLVRAELRHQDVASLLSAAGLEAPEDASPLPSILIMVAELPADEILMRFWWHADAMLTRTQGQEIWVGALEQAGFRVIQPPTNWREELPEELQLRLATMALQSVPERTAAIALARHFEAEALLLGETLLQPVPPLNPEHIRIKAEYQIVDVETGLTLAAVSQATETPAATPRDALEGLQQVITACVQPLQAELQHTRLAAPPQAPTRFELVLEGQQRLSLYMEFRRQLSLLEGISEVTIHEIGTARAVLKVTYAGSAEALANTLKKATFSGFKITLERIQAERLHLRLVSG